jgi:hypothetical protein
VEKFASARLSAQGICGTGLALVPFMRNLEAPVRWPPKPRLTECSIESTIELALAEVNELRAKFLRAKNPALKREYESQWRGARGILAALYGLKKSLIHAN